MSADTKDLVLEQLRHMRAKLEAIANEQTNHGVQLSAIGQQLAGMTTAIYGGLSELGEIKRRVERLERREEIAQ
jgi:hypothetical protein